MKKKLFCSGAAVFLMGAMMLFFNQGGDVNNNPGTDPDIKPVQYKASYDYKPSYTGAKDFYYAGERVELEYPFIATDTDYYFSVTDANGNEVDIDVTPEYKIIFIMPECDVKVETETRNSMVYVVE